ncbi:MAG: TRAP transporter large permease subunit, partial [Novosphingobium sp.]
SLYLGVVTPTEAGALGAVMAAVLCLLRGLFSFRLFWAAVLEAVMVTGFILLIVFAASLLTFIFDFLRISQTILAVSTDAGLGPFTVFLILAVFYIVLGMFLDSISLITLTLPVVMPLVLSLGLDPVWFGIVLVLLVEIGLITPPIGLNLFVLQGVGKISLRDVSLGAVPFGTVMVLFLFLLYFVPSLVTWLPELVK